MRQTASARLLKHSDHRPAAAMQLTVSGSSGSTAGSRSRSGSVLLQQPRYAACSEARSGSIRAAVRAVAKSCKAAVTDSVSSASLGGA
jgi:hypothetical protein